MGNETEKNNNESEVSGKFAMIPNEILGMLGKNVRTPAGTVEKIDGDDLAWWGFFFTFRYQKMKCYQTRQTISDRFDCDVKTVTRRTARLERLGLLTIEQRKGTSNIYTATSVEEFLAMKTREKVTPKTEEKKENGKSEMQAPIDASTNQPADESAGQNTSLPVVSDTPVVGQQADVESNDDNGNAGTNINNAVAQEVQIFDEHGVITEAFINSLKGDYAPHRNDDGTLHSFRYVYLAARYTQDMRDGVTVRTNDEYMAEAKPRHVPSHLLSTTIPTSQP
ncbi:hypothetical protein [Klebsiella sp. BIGb0407]|uniref:hypothetical protein n=1 Tax=Klebsiella sp. BIGb0407 TaxID=2940603 RepID=UPI002168A2A8|nr:hypothetical protein [Klebsiella sp. BIGb0407]MCS3430577.1 hypothetical protein [Klebsiella sp. BIGb0407]